MNQSPAADPMRVPHYPPWHGGMAAGVGVGGEAAGLGGMAAMLQQQQKQQQQVQQQQQQQFMQQRRLHLQQVRQKWVCSLQRT